MNGVAVLIMLISVIFEADTIPTSTTAAPLFPEKCPAGSYGFIADPDHGQDYYLCPAGEKYSCDEGLAFDQTIYACNYEESVEVLEGISCPAPKGLFAHPTNCNKYLNCDENIPHVQDCSAGLWFDEEKETCELPVNVACGASG